MEKIFTTGTISRNLENEVINRSVLYIDTDRIEEVDNKLFIKFYEYLDDVLNIEAGSSEMFFITTTEILDILEFLDDWKDNDIKKLRKYIDDLGKYDYFCFFFETNEEED